MNGLKRKDTSPSCRKVGKDKTLPVPVSSSRYRLSAVCSKWSWAHQFCCHCINLHFVQVSDWFDIRRPIAQFNKKNLIMFKSVGRTHHCIVQTIGMEVFVGFANALFEVGGGNDLQILVGRQTLLNHFTFGGFGVQRINSQTSFI